MKRYRQDDENVSHVFIDRKESDESDESPRDDYAYVKFATFALIWVVALLISLYWIAVGIDAL